MFTFPLPDLTWRSRARLFVKIGPDGSWQQIVMEGVRNMNKYYWRPAFTVQVGQMDESPEDRALGHAGCLH